MRCVSRVEATTGAFAGILSTRAAFASVSGGRIFNYPNGGGFFFSFLVWRLQKPIAQHFRGRANMPKIVRIADRFVHKKRFFILEKISAIAHLAWNEALEIHENDGGGDGAEEAATGSGMSHRCLQPLELGIGTQKYDHFTASFI